MGLRRLARNYLSKRLARDIAHPASHSVQSTISLMRPVATVHELIRIGGPADGGYLLPDDLDGIVSCFSPGVSTTADFEMQLAKDFKIRSFLADGTVEGPPEPHELLHFTKKNIGAADDENLMTMEGWVAGAPDLPATGDLLLQMDIENAEYEALIFASRDLLRRFRIITIEFHSVGDLMSGIDLGLFVLILKKLNADFVVAHLHANNAADTMKVGSVEIPQILELTLLRRDRVKPGGPTPVLPHPLDRDNVDTRPPIKLQKIWWSDQGS